MLHMNWSPTKDSTIPERESKELIENKKIEKEVMKMERIPELSGIFGDPSFLAEIKEARKFRNTFCRRRKMLEKTLSKE